MLRGQLQDAAETVNKRFGQVRGLGEKGLLPQAVVTKAAASFFAYRSAMDKGTNPAEQTPNSESTITPFETAIASIAIVDAYTSQEGEEIFSLDREFYPIFGRLCVSLPQGADAVIDTYHYRKARHEAVRKVISGMDELEKNEEAGETINLLRWIDSHIKDKQIFFNALLAAEDYGDENSHINLREKFRDVLVAGNEKFFSLHPQKREIVTAVKTPEAEPEEKKPITPYVVEVSGTVEPDIPVKIVNPEKAPETKEPEITLSDSELETLSWLTQEYKKREPVLMQDLEEARRVAAGAGHLLLYNKFDDLKALFNLIIYRANGVCMTPYELEAITPHIRKLFGKKPKS